MGWECGVLALASFGAGAGVFWFGRRFEAAVQQADIDYRVRDGVAQAAGVPHSERQKRTHQHRYGTEPVSIVDGQAEYRCSGCLDRYYRAAP